ncbi:lactadherin [Nematostella vectensis]|uniref:lactadherin n=1 Tax=Nematostella vectensis TaxID=45351 RepID=UPI00207755EA|nr:lactadherin [Nematostella vectensis]
MTSLPSNTSAYKARLYRGSGWSPITFLEVQDTLILLSSNYVQIDLKAVWNVLMAAVTGVPRESPIPFSTIAMSFSMEGFEWKTRVDPHRQQIIPEINKEQVTVAMALMSVERARYVRINIPPYRRTDGASMAFTVEIFACGASTVISGGPVAVGVASRLAIPDSHLTSPSSIDALHGPEHARLDTKVAGGGWCAVTCDPTAFLQIDLGKSWEITMVEVQGKHTTTGHLSGVQSFTLSSSVDGAAWVPVQQDGAVKVFIGNFVENMSTKHKLNQPFTARYVRFEPRTCSENACLRVELYGHTVGETETPNVFERSMLLNKGSGELFVCLTEVPRNKPHCHVTKDRGSSWTSLSSQIMNIVAFDKDDKSLYGLSKNMTHTRSKDGINWASVTNRKWKAIRNRPSLTTAREIPFIPLTNALEPIVQLKSYAGDTWIANQIGVYHKPPGGVAQMKASFLPHPANR